MAKSGTYTSYQAAAMGGRIVLDRDPIWCLLVTAAYLWRPDLHSCRADVVGEVRAEGYEAGGKRLTGCLVVEDPLSHCGAFLAENLMWTRTKIVGAAGCVIYCSRGSAEKDELIAYLGFDGEADAGENESFSVVWAREGVLTLGRSGEDRRP